MLDVLTAETHPRPRTKLPEERRVDLLDAATRLFVAKGVGGTTVDDITRAAGVAKGTFYLHYASKEVLVQALQHRYSERFGAAITEAAAAHDDWGAKLDACVDASLTSMAATSELHDVLFRHAAHPVDDAPGANRLVDALRELLDEGVAAGAFDVNDVEATAVLLFAALHGIDPGFTGALVAPDRTLLATKALFRRTTGLR